MKMYRTAENLDLGRAYGAYFSWATEQVSFIEQQRRWEIAKEELGDLLEVAEMCYSALVTGCWLDEYETEEEMLVA